MSNQPFLTHGESVMSALTGIYVFLTGVYVVVSILSLRRISHQWDAMKAANDIGRNNLEAMKESNEISRRSLEAVQRAFVFLKTTSIMSVPDQTYKKVVAIQFNATWENGGSTPTKELETLLCVIGFPTEMPKGYKLPDRTDPSINAQRIPMVLGPKCIIVTPNLEVPIAHFQTQHVYLYGTATYKDVFDDTPQHTTNFCMKVSIFGDPASLASKHALISHFEHNYAD
jgi:hypothetical protein